MTEKTILQQINNLAFDMQHTDDLQVAFEKASEILKLTDHDTPLFAVGEYYSYSDSNDSYIFKITNINDPYYETLEFSLGLNQLTKDKFHFDSNFTRESKPATADQIATFKRAKQFASKGRKLDEFKGWDTVAFNGVGKTVIGTNDDCVVLCDTAIKKNNPELILIETAEELQEVENND